MQKINTEPKNLTRQQLADRLGVHLLTIKRWEREGRLKPVHLGPRTIRYPLDYVREMEEKGLKS